MAVAAVSTVKYHILVSELEQDGEKFEAGTLWTSNDFQREDGATIYTMADNDDCKKTVASTLTYMPSVTLANYLLFIAMRNPKDRLQVFIDVTWRKEGVEIEPGDKVQIINHPVRELNGLVGVIQFKGELNDPKKKGTYFGIELEDKGKGTSDGEYCNQRLFQCEENCAIFVTMFRIRKIIPRKTRTKQDHNTVLYGERVVWLTDHGPECGTVKWIGVLPDSVDGSFTIGVEFDNPVGTGTGKYKGHRLFQTAPGHASLVPPMGLIKFHEYYRDQKEKAKNGELAATTTAAPIVMTPAPPVVTVVSSTSQSRSVGSATRPSQPRAKKAAPEQSASVSSNSYEDADSLRTQCGEGSRSKDITPSFGKLSIESKRTKGHRNHRVKSKVVCLNPREAKLTGFKIGDKVEVDLNGKRKGIIRWLGKTIEKPKPLAGLEMEDMDTKCYTSGTFEGETLFECLPYKSLFLYVHLMKKCD